MDFLPAPQGQEGQGCSKGPRCVVNSTTSQCPGELKAPGGCNNACTVFKEDKYCCTGTAANNCGPTNYAFYFARICPDAYANPKDDDNKTFTCPSGINYQVVFCPPIDLAVAPSPVVASSSPTSAPIGRLTSEGSSARSILVVILAGFISLVTLFSIIFFVSRRRIRRRQEMEEEFGELQGTPMRFTFQRLKVATDQFRNKLGEGGFGSVFEGQFGEERIAVKRLDRTGQGKKEFLAKVQTIGSIHHINLVRLIGFCAEESHRLLVYEYMAKGSLDRWIYCRHDKHSNEMQVDKQEEVIQMMKLAMWCLQIDWKRRPQMSEVVKVLEGTMNAETNIDHNFVATCPASFGIVGNVGSSAPPLASHVSGPR